MRYGRLIGALAAAVLAVAPFVAAHVLTRPAPAVVAPPPSDLAAAAVTIVDEHGAHVAGWLAMPLAASSPRRAGVLLLHGVRAHRGHLVQRQRLFARAGYATLAIDLFAHGESPGDRITFGHRESASARAAVAWLRRHLPGHHIAAVGLSLGGAALLLGPEPANVDALVLEAVYADIRNATADRIAMAAGEWGRALTPLVVWPAAALLGVHPAELRPVAGMARVAAPVLIIGGVRDRHTPIADTRALYAAAAGPKELWEIADAGHYDFERHVPAEWRRRVLDFLARHLGG